MIANEKLYAEGMLVRIAEELQLSATQFRRAKEEYEGVGAWLSRPESAFHGLNPSVYPQGSMALQTTVRPKERVEYDLDVVLQLDRWGRTIREYHGALQSELHKYARSKGEQGPTVQTKPRCVRLQYTKSFHFDVVPATVDAKIGGTAIVVPDRELTRWRPNNPLLYQRWFEERCIVHRSVMAEARCQAPLPDNAGVRDKAPLKIAVQLVKRRRDRWYASRRRDNDAPPSIVVTTLAAEHYDGVDNVCDALDALASQLQLLGTSPDPVLINPAVPGENLLNGWTADRLKVLAEFGSHFGFEINALARGGPNGVQLLEEMFGEPVKGAYAKLAADMKRLGDSSSLRVSRTGLLGGTGVAVQPHTFYGE